MTSGDHDLPEWRSLSAFGKVRVLCALPFFIAGAAVVFIGAAVMWIGALIAQKEKGE